MTWAMVFMLCTKTCVAEYVETYPSRAACVKNIPKDTYYTVRCLPVSKD